MKTRRLTATISDMGPGGAQRVLSILLNYWASCNWQITLLTFDNNPEATFYSLDKKIKLQQLAIAKPFRNKGTIPMEISQRIGVLKQAIKASNPDVVLSFLDVTNIFTLFATRGLKIPTIVSERTDPGGRKIPWIWDRLKKFTYPSAFSVVCQGKRAMGYFSSRVQAKGAVIANPVMIPPEYQSLTVELSETKDRFSLAALGRLVPEKAYDVLLEAFATASKKSPDWDLIVWGEGPLRAELEGKALQLGISERVNFAGITRAPMVELVKCDLFVMASRVEGFPNALTEAMSLGLPVVATDVGAVAEIIQNGENGLLVQKENPGELATALSMMMTDGDLRRRLALNSKSILARFGLESVSQKWEDLFERATAGKIQGA